MFSCSLGTIFPFSNYHIIDQIITELAPVAIQRKTDRNFRSARMTFKCMPNEGYTNLMLASVWACEWNTSWWHICEGGFLLHSELQDSSKTGLVHCSVFHHKAFYICQVEDKCSQLMFQVPSCVQQKIFPLSSEQERAQVAACRSDQADLWKLSSLPRCVPFQ